MAANSSQRSTCWTCRLRHKKCDQKVPVCENCTALGIECHSGVEKPPWMDGGDSQHVVKTRLKAQVKHAARRRRGAAMMDKIASDLSATPADAFATDKLPSRVSNPRESASSRDPLTHLPRGEPRPSSTGPESSLRDGAETHPERTSEPMVSPGEPDLGLVMAYLDYVFPILFPHYRPRVVNGGRSWLLSLAMTSKSFLKGLVSLSSMFLSIIPSEVGPGHETCASETWEELRNQADMALVAMQHDLRDITGRGIQNCLSDSVHLFASTMQLLVLELSITPPEKWQIHLNAAIELFEQIMCHHAREDSATDIRVVSDKLGRPSWTAPDLYSADQGAFRFFSSVLVFSDVIASTSLGCSPRLRTYHSDLGPSESSQKPALSLERVTGCQDWLIRVLGDTMVLKEWRDDQSRAGELLKSELYHRGILLDERLESGLETMGSRATAKRNSEPVRPLEMLFKHSTSDGSLEVAPEKYLNLTRIWALATRTYLFAIITDGRLEDPNIRSSVEQALCLLLEVRSPIWLRSLVWPICIIGCYAMEKQRPILRTIANHMSALGGFGTGRLTSEIMEHVWRRRDAGFEYRDPSTCLKVSGDAVLLM